MRRLQRENNVTKIITIGLLTIKIHLSNVFKNAIQIQNANLSAYNGIVVVLLVIFIQTDARNHSKKHQHVRD